MQLASTGLARCLPWGSQSPLLAGMRPDRGAMAVGNLPPFPSAVCQSASRKGSKSVNIFVTAWVRARLCMSEQSRKRARDCVLSRPFRLWRAFQKKKGSACVSKGAVVILCHSQQWRAKWWTTQKVDDCILSWWRWRWVCDTCWHLRDLRCESKLWPSQVSCIYIGKQHMFLTKSSVNNTVHCSPAGTQFLNLLSLIPMWTYDNRVHSQRAIFTSSLFLSTVTRTGVTLVCCYRCWWWDEKRTLVLSLKTYQTQKHCGVSCFESGF